LGLILRMPAVDLVGTWQSGILFVDNLITTLHRTVAILLP
jgi:hypothetical protein